MMTNKYKFTEEDMTNINNLAEEITAEMDQESDGSNDEHAMVYATLEYLMGSFMESDSDWVDFVLEAAHEVAFNLLPEETQAEIVEGLNKLHNVSTTVAH